MQNVRIQSKITLHMKNQKISVTYGKKSTDDNAVMTEILKPPDKNLKAVIVKMFSKVRMNTLETNRKRKSQHRDRSHM